MEYMALATGIRVALLSGMTGSAIMEYSLRRMSKRAQEKQGTSIVFSTDQFVKNAIFVSQCPIANQTM